MQYAILYLATIPVFILLDLLWLGVVARGYYQSRLAGLLGPVEWYAAGLFYLVFILGLLIFVVVPGIKEQSLTHIIVYGLLFGLVTYGTYDLTNLATLKGWPVGLTFFDMAWGAFLSAAVASWGYGIATRVLGLA